MTNLFRRLGPAALIAAVAFAVPSALAVGRAGQPAQSPDALEAILQQAFGLLDRSELDQARALFERVLAQVQDDRPSRVEADARRGLGIVLYRKSDYRAARAELERAVRVYEEVGDRRGLALAHDQLGSVLSRIGDRPGARALYAKALAEFEAAGSVRDQANTLRNLALLPDASYADRASLMEKAWLVARAIEDRRLDGTILHTWGDFLFAQGDFAAANEKLQAARTLLADAGDRYSLARALTSLGRVQRAHGYPDRAVEFYRQALKIQEDLGDLQGQSQSHNAIAIALGLLKRHREALADYQRAADLARATGSPPVISFQLGQLGIGYFHAGEYARAVELLEEVLRDDRDPATAPVRYSWLSKAYFAQGRHAEASKAVETAIELTRTLGNLEWLFEMLHHRAMVNGALGRSAEALADSREALDAIDGLRDKLAPSDFLKRGFGDQHRQLFASSIRLLATNGHSAEALEATERARARAFLDLLATREAQPGGAGAVPRGAAGPAGAGERHADDPDLQSAISAPSPSAAEVTGVVERLDSTLLSYWVDSDATYVWVGRRDGSIDLRRIEVSAERLDQLVRISAAGALKATSSGAARPERPVEVESRDWKNAASPSGTPRDSAVGTLPKGSTTVYRQLYDLLIRPVRELLPNAPGNLLTIVPHGPLFRLSFASLLDERGRYLVETYRLHYTPSVGVLNFTGRTRARVPPGPPRFLFVADPAFAPRASSEDPLPMLPGSRREAAAVMRLLPAPAVTLLTGSAAREERVRALIGDSTVVHFATHGLVWDDRPLQSYLALAGAGPTPSDDGRLTTQEIYGLALRADLIVLSACRSGGGKISGDGIAGMARAFFYAGAPSVLATLSDLDDESARYLLPRFYRAWQTSGDKSGALRTAQLQLLRALRSGQMKVSTPIGDVTLPEHPMLWANLVLMGEL